jgi:hypothetical protein
MSQIHVSAIYIYIYVERETERQRDRDRKRERENFRRDRTNVYCAKLFLSLARARPQIHVSAAEKWQRQAAGRVPGRLWKRKEFQKEARKCR